MRETVAANVYCCGINRGVGIIVFHGGTHKSISHGILLRKLQRLVRGINYTLITSGVFGWRLSARKGVVCGLRERRVGWFASRV